MLVWFSIDLAALPGDPQQPMIRSRVNPECMKTYIRNIRTVDPTVVHLISIGGWNSPHPVTSVDVEDMYNALRKWNVDEVDGLLDGMDWDIEGNDDKADPSNHMSVECVHFMGRFSQLAKMDGMIVTMAPAESYLDSTVNGFDRSLRHTYYEWDDMYPEFTYHGMNTYAPLLSS